jgi:hypothetical protein
MTLYVHLGRQIIEFHGFRNALPGKEILSAPNADYHDLIECDRRKIAALGTSADNPVTPVRTATARQ